VQFLEQFNAIDTHIALQHQVEPGWKFVGPNSVA
jgi:hypothetical protein